MRLADLFRRLVPDMPPEEWAVIITLALAAAAAGDEWLRWLASP